MELNRVCVLILFCLIFLFLQNNTSILIQPRIQNDGAVTFCDTRTFKSEILEKLPKTPLTSLGVESGIKPSPMYVSGVTNFFISELNKVSNGCFHLIKVYSVTVKNSLTNTILDCVLHVYTQAKNHTMVINLVAYVDGKSDIYIHSANLVNPVYVEDKWSDKPVAWVDMEFVEYDESMNQVENEEYNLAKRKEEFNLENIKKQKAIDKSNETGVITGDMFGSVHGDMAPFYKADKNGDGVVNRNEALAAATNNTTSKIKFEPLILDDENAPLPYNGMLAGAPLEEEEVVVV